jgi:hypothetical protein
LSAYEDHTSPSNIPIQIQFESIPIGKIANYFPRHKSFARIANFEHFFKKCRQLSAPFPYLHHLALPITS